MKRMVIIAQAEFMALVRSKFFLVGIFVMPVLVTSVVSGLGYVDRRVDRSVRTFALVDETGIFGPVVLSEAEKQRAENAQHGERTGPHFVPEIVVPDGRSHDDLTVLLSERIRRGDLFAFAYIPATVLDPAQKTPIEYYSQNTSYVRLSTWLSRILGDAIQQRRLERAGLDAASIRSLMARASMTSFGLVERQADGSATERRKVEALQQFGVPVFYMVVMFMAVMSNAQHLINSTIEEKVSKISEVLLGSVSAFELLGGKLLGIVTVSFLLAFVYLAGGAYTLFSLGRVDLIDPGTIAWFLVFLLCASLLFGALFQALSSACSDMKDAQSLLQPAMMLLMLSYFSSFVVLRAPDSTLAAWLSFIPLQTPFAMMLRIAVPPGPPLWQLLLSVAMLMGVTAGTVWVAGRIFRVGLLMQGKAPNLPELLRWIRK
jgi:ABC-2 type transport system permease protein